MSSPRDETVVEAIDRVLDWSLEKESRIGYFAALYRHVAVALGTALALGEFRDREAMEGVNEEFFNRYLDAFHRLERGEPITLAWQTAFDAAAATRPNVVQHLLLGANAHINLDLAIGVARAIPSGEMEQFRPDYEHMNGLLASLLGEVTAEVGRVLPVVRAVSSFAERENDVLLAFSIRRARESAWAEAQRLAALPEAERETAIHARDARVAALGRRILAPGIPVSLLLPLLRVGEVRSVRETIEDVLDAGPKGRPAGPAPARRRAAGPPFAHPERPRPATPARRRRKVAILGGGQAALTAALQLTDPDNPGRDELDITIYQLGWRLGGKGATGRPKDEPWKHDRIEEHGLHNWFGFYDNSFAQARRVYEELRRPKGAPLATFEQAFEPANEAVFVERIEGRPRLWTIQNLTNDLKPGEGGIWDEPWAYVEMALEAVERMVLGSRVAAFADGHPALSEVDERVGDHAAVARGADLLRLARHLAATARHRKQEGKSAHHPLAHLVDRIRRDVERIARAPFERFAHEVEDVTARALCWVLSLFTTLLWDVVRDGIETAAKDEERRLWVPANLAYACIAGAVRDGVLEHGFDVVNDVDFREWITKYAHDDGGVMLRSPMVEAIYTASFAYPDGNATVPDGGSYAPAEDMEAGSTLRGFVRTLFGYKGAFAYRFRAGTADTCYAPAYEVLKRRGVEFAFFHRVERLDVERGRVTRVVLREQAQLAGGAYDPLYDVGGLPCWPSTPHWEQLHDGEWFRARGADFECPSPEVRAREWERVLEVGRDFDDVVCGISIAALPSVCAGLVERSPKWAAAVRHVKTVRTQALQLWLAPAVGQLGFTIAGRPIVTWLYDRESPLNVWGDFSELIPQEGWTPDCRPHLLGYFCSTMPDDGADPFDPFPDQHAADGRVRENALELLGKGIETLLPGAVRNGEFDWSLLLDPRAEPGTGPERLDSQYYRANVTPTERYVLSVKGSSKHRLPVHDPKEVANLYLAGDWTECTLNMGCMEAATISGMLCANALSGFPRRKAIVGVDF